MDATWLSTFWASIIALALLFYVILDGYDLGVGILFGVTSDSAFRDTMMDSIAPFWDGNGVWLILVGAGLFAAFPVVYSIFLPAFYLPITIMLAGLIFRGVAFEFRYHAISSKFLWETGFFLGSLVVTFVQGVAIGRMIQGLPVINGQYAGGPFDWLTPFSVFCGMGLVLGYALLGSAWLILRTQGQVQEWAYSLIRWILAGVVIALVCASSYILFTHPRVRDRWLKDIWLAVLPIMIILSCTGLLSGLKKHVDWVPYGMAIILFAASFLALEASFWPYMIPFTVTIDDAAAPAASLSFLFYGAGIVIFPIVLLYTAYVYSVFRGKV